MRSGGRVSASATGAVPLPDPMNHQETGAYWQFCPLQCKRRRDDQGADGHKQAARNANCAYFILPITVRSGPANSEKAKAACSPKRPENR